MTQSSFDGTLPKKQDTFCPPFKLISVGDDIEVGSYALHSRFHKAINFVKQRGVKNDWTLRGAGTSSERLVSLVDEDVGAGPGNIVVQGLHFPTVHSLRITEDTLRINDCSIPLDKNRQYHSTIDFTTIKLEQFEKRLALFETLLLRSAHPKSLMFLLDERRMQYFQAGFERAVAERIQTGVHEIFHGKLYAGVQAIKGVGFGLTPGGDDFVSGLLLGLFVIQNVYGKDLSEVRKQVYRLAAGKNLLSNTFLYWAKEGLLLERWKAVMTALLAAETENALYKATQRLLSIGETSGADSAAGFLLTLRRNSYGCQRFFKTGRIF